VVLRTGDRLGAGRPSQRLGAIAGQQQTVQVVAEAAPLRQAANQQVELGGVVLERIRRGRAGRRRLLIALVELLAADRTINRTVEAYPAPTNYR
jgi:hypothetical protein